MGKGEHEGKGKGEGGQVEGTKKGGQVKGTSGRKGEGSRRREKALLRAIVS